MQKESGGVCWQELLWRCSTEADSKPQSEGLSSWQAWKGSHADISNAPELNRSLVHLLTFTWNPRHASWFQTRPADEDPLVLWEQRACSSPVGRYEEDFYFCVVSFYADFIPSQFSPIPCGRESMKKAATCNKGLLPLTLNLAHGRQMCGSPSEAPASSILSEGYIWAFWLGFQNCCELPLLTSPFLVHAGPHESQKCDLEDRKLFQISKTRSRP